MVYQYFIFSVLNKRRWNKLDRDDEIYLFIGCSFIFFKAKKFVIDWSRLVFLGFSSIFSVNQRHYFQFSNLWDIDKLPVHLLMRQLYAVWVYHKRNDFHRIQLCFGVKFNDFFSNVKSSNCSINSSTQILALNIYILHFYYRQTQLNRQTKTRVYVNSYQRHIYSTSNSFYKIWSF